MDESRNLESAVIVKWLRVLMYIAIASLVNSIVSFIPAFPASATTWISRGIMLAMVVCMYQLSSVNDRYRKSWIMRASMLACTLITAFLFASSVLTLAASICSIIAVYQEYNGHSELIADSDSGLARKWHSLFNWSILVAVLVSFGSTVTVMILSFIQMDAVGSVDITLTTAIVVGILSIPQIILDLVYVMYIEKMIAIFGKFEVS